MGTHKTVEQKLFLELGELLKKNEDKILSGQFKVCLTTSSLAIVTSNDADVTLNASTTVQRSWSFSSRSLDQQRWDERKKWLLGFVLKIKALKIIHGSCTIKAPIKIGRFNNLHVLEVKKVPIHMLEGLSRLRGQLTDITVTRSIQSLQELLEVCGGDGSSGKILWPHLKSAYLSWNGLSQLDDSLSCVPFVEVLDLSHNNLTTEGEHLKCLTEVVRCNLGFNMLTRFPSFSVVNRSKLKTLVLSSNSLENLEGLDELMILEELDVADNLLLDHRVLEVLSGLNMLRVLCLMGNPLSYHPRHRLQTVTYLSPLTAGHGAFLLDGLRLAPDEIKIQKQRFYRKSLDVTLIDTHGNGSMRGSSASDPICEVDGGSGNGALLQPGGHQNKRKRGHRRIHSKERIVDIVDLEEALSEEHNSRAPSPTGSFVDETDLSQAERDKQKIEVMREYYKDDWLKALALGEAAGTSSTTLAASTAGNQVLAEVQVEPQRAITPVADESKREAPSVAVESKRDIAPVRVELRKKSRPASGASNRGKILISSQAIVLEKAEAPVVAMDTVDSSGFVLEQALKAEQVATLKAGRSPDLSTPAKTTNQKSVKDPMDFYALNRGISVDTPDMPIKSPDMPAGDYGDESEPFIVMLPDEGLKQLFVTVNERFVTEKDVNGDKLCSLDLKCLKNVRRSEEQCFSTNVADGVTLPILTLDFDYVQRDKRQRRYAMEDDDFSKKLVSLISHHIPAKKLTETMECLRCLETFELDISSSTGSKLHPCPKCKSKMVIKANTTSLEKSPETSGAQKTTSDDDETASDVEKNPPFSTSRRRSNAFIQSSQEVAGSLEKESRYSSSLKALSMEMPVGSLSDYVDRLLSDQSYDQAGHRSAVFISQQEEDTEEDNQTEQDRPFSSSASSVSEASGLHTVNSWSDIRKSHYTAQSSVSSVDSDITILATQSKGSIATISESSLEVIPSPTVTIVRNSPREKNLLNLDASKGDVALTTANGTPWVKDEKGQLTPVGSPLSNSVCSSMVSSVYENTLSGGGDDKSSSDDGVQVISREGSLTSSSTDSVSIRRSSKKSASRSANRNVSVINDQLFLKDSNTDSRLCDDSSLYTTAGALSSANISVHTEDESETSVYDTILTDNSKDSSRDDLTANQDSACHSSPLRGGGSERRSPKKRSAIYEEEALESESELSEKSDLSSFPDELSPIKRTVSTRRARQGKTVALCLNYGDEIDVSNQVGTSLEGHYNDSVVSRETTSSNSGLPWEQESCQEEETPDQRHESLIHDEFVNIDHRLQLFLELQVFKHDEVCQCAVQCSIVQYMNSEEMLCLLVISTNRILIFQVTGDISSGDVSDSVHCIEDQPITELVYVDIGYAYQTLRLEFGTVCSSFSLLMCDEARCKQFLTLLSDIVQTAALQNHSKLEGISKSNPVTQDNLHALLKEVEGVDEEVEEQTLVKYLLIKYSDDDSDSDVAKTMTLLVTTSHLLLVEENHQWPLPRLQAPLSPEVKGQQFTLVQKERINNIEGIEFNEYNPCELRLTFETSDSTNAKKHWMVTMASTKGIKSFVDAIRDPWEKDFGVSLDITSSSFSEVE